MIEATSTPISASMENITDGFGAVQLDNL